MYCTNDDCLLSLDTFSSMYELQQHNKTDHNKPVWLYLLGAGASIDSGLVTYRGTNGINTSYKNMTTLSSFKYLEKKIKNNKPGLTYDIINRISPPNSMIITQNIDGYAHSTDLKIIDIHMHEGYELVYENIVQIGQNVSKNKMMNINKFIKHKKPRYMIVIGTSLQFPYLREIINKTKRYAKIIHINPDPDYKYNIRKNEYWIKDNASNGLLKLPEFIENNNIKL